MKVKYIYDERGKIEFAVIPITDWELLKKNLGSLNNSTEIAVQKPKKFDPSQYEGIFSHLNIDVEREIQNMRNEWKINI